MCPVVSGKTLVQGPGPDAPESDNAGEFFLIKVSIFRPIHKLLPLNNDVLHLDLAKGNPMHFPILGLLESKMSSWKYKTGN